VFEFLKKILLKTIRYFWAQKVQYQYLLVKVWAIPAPIQNKYCQYFIAHTFLFHINNPAADLLLTMDDDEFTVIVVIVA